MKYRSDIDGLRCIAVLAVVLFHLNVPAFHGGFVGVDVFFVISGYLISSLLANELRSEAHPIRTFYYRRANRILPALFVMLLCILVLSGFVAFQVEMREIVMNTISTALFTSNIYLLSQSGYFADASAASPLLHTWSLAVEEQFYILYPLFLKLAIRKKQTSLNAYLIALTLLSFVASVVSLSIDRDAAFYLLPGRAWEFLIGAYIAFNTFRLPERIGSFAISPKVARDILVLAGLAMVGLSIRYYSPGTPFPGPTAILPCLGAALIIEAGKGEGAFFQGLLKSRPAVFFGLISYSLYLWHWPIMVFYRTLVDASLTPWSRVIVLLLSIAAATLSWRYVERPFRRSQAGHEGTTGYPAPRSRGIPYPLAWISCSFALVMGLATVFTVSSGFGQGSSQEAERLAQYLKYDDTQAYRRGTCFITYKEKLSDFDKTLCLRKTPDKPNILLIGDSHAAHLWYGLSNVLTRYNVLQATSAGCKPVLDARGEKNCQAFRSSILQDYLPGAKLDAVMLAANWNASDIQYIGETIAYLKKYVPEVIVVGPIVAYRLPLPRLLAVKTERKEDKRSVADAVISDRYGVDRDLKAAVQDAGGNYVSALGSLCSSGRCITVTDDGSPLQFDTYHLTAGGSVLLARIWRQNNAISVPERTVSH